MDLENYFITAKEMKEEIVENDVVRRIYTGENIQVVEYRFPANKTFPPHSHSIHEQMGYLVSGKMGFKIGDKTHDLLPGQWYHAPIGVEHNAWTYDEPSVLLDIFSPPRDDLK
ncbi:MAG: cupin domain-containing protein [Spirochaetales bacterium]|nr:cupin domain-containing protein [Spirochaetales bacterium]